MAGFCCFRCGDLASCDLQFLDLFRPVEGGDCVLVREPPRDQPAERVAVKLQRCCFGNTAYLRIFLKPNKFQHSLTFDTRRICDLHMGGKCPRGAECTMLHPCRKEVLKYFPTMFPTAAAPPRANHACSTPAAHSVRGTPAETFGSALDSHS